MRSKIKSFLNAISNRIFKAKYIYVVVIKKRTESFNQVYACYELNDAVELMNRYNTDNVLTARLTKIEIK